MAIKFLIIKKNTECEYGIIRYAEYFLFYMSPDIHYRVHPGKWQKEIKWTLNGGLVCVHTRKAWINHQNNIGARGGGVRREVRIPYKAVCLTQRGVEWRTKEWLNTKSPEQQRALQDGARLGDWMLKRDCSKEDFSWATERKQAGSEVSSDAIIELWVEKECERQGKRLITGIIGRY